MMGVQTSTPELSVVVPCFDERDAIGDTIRRLEEVLEGQFDYEIIVVDDASTDGTKRILNSMLEGDQHPRLVMIEHARNRGYGAAVKTGIRRARSEVIAITDADGTYPSDRLPELVRMIGRVDMAVGARVGSRVSYSWLRRVPKLFLGAYASWLVGEQIPDMNSGLRVFRKSIAERLFGVLPDGFSLTTTITVAMMRGRYQVSFVPIDYAPRVGRSKIQPIRDTLRFIQLIFRTGMYFAPIRVLLPLVVVLSAAFCVSFAYDVFVLRDLTEKTLILLLFSMNTALFALLADMIDKRS